jgi:serine/threonine-protein kinase RsbW
MGVLNKNISFAICSTPEQITIVIKKLEQFLSVRGVTDEFVNEASLGLSEAVANAIIHGNQINPDKKVYINLNCNDKKLFMTVRDEGPGFSLDQIPNPLSQENRMKTSGRGIYLIKASIDHVKFKKLPAGMQVELVKYF